MLWRHRNEDTNDHNYYKKKMTRTHWYSDLSWINPLSWGSPKTYQEVWEKIQETQVENEEKAWKIEILKWPKLISKKPGQEITNFEVLTRIHNLTLLLYLYGEILETILLIYLRYIPFSEALLYLDMQVWSVTMPYYI